jgi:hypothetical protein
MPDAGVARGAEDATELAGLVVVIRDELLARTADSAPAALLSNLLLELLLGDPVGAEPADLGVIAMPTRDMVRAVPQVLRPRPLVLAWAAVRPHTVRA